MVGIDRHAVAFQICLLQVGEGLIELLSDNARHIGLRRPERGEDRDVVALRDPLAGLRVLLEDVGLRNRRVGLAHHLHA